MLRRSGVITSWYDGEIIPGVSWEREISKNLKNSQITLLLISADFIDSDYCYTEEMTYALKRHQEGKACVIPIILRPVDWTGMPFAHLQVLPADARPVTSWKNRDKAFTNIIDRLSRFPFLLHTQ